MKFLLSIALILLSSVTGAQDWTPYEAVLNRARMFPDIQYAPPKGERCYDILAPMVQMARERGYVVEKRPNDFIASLFPKELGVVTAFGATIESIHVVLLNESFGSCGMARALGHELGHIETIDQPDDQGEIMAELIQLGVMLKINKNPKFDVRYSTAMYLSSFKEKSGRSISIFGIKKPVLENIKSNVFRAVNDLTRGYAQ